jgi:hypothetical protein
MFMYCSAQVMSTWEETFKFAAKKKWMGSDSVPVEALLPGCLAVLRDVVGFHKDLPLKILEHHPNV